MNGEAQIAVAVRAPEEIPPNRLIANQFATRARFYADRLALRRGGAIGIGMPRREFSA
jgi:hypothetical protein